MARGDLLLVDLPPTPGGREQTGSRPAVAVQTDDVGSDLPTLMVVPLTGQLGALRFPFTVRIEPTTANGLTKPSVLLVFQLRAIDRRRVIAKLGRLEQEHIERLDTEMRSLLNLH